MNALLGRIAAGRLPIWLVGSEDVAAARDLASQGLVCLAEPHPTKGTHQWTPAVQVVALTATGLAEATAHLESGFADFCA